MFSAAVADPMVVVEAEVVAVAGLRVAQYARSAECESSFVPSQPAQDFLHWIAILDDLDLFRQSWHGLSSRAR